MPNTKIMTFIGYENLFPHIEKEGLIIPNSYLDNDENIDELVNSIIKDFDSIEVVSFSSFLNSIVQTSGADQTQEIGWNEIKLCGLVDNDDNQGIIFHRDNLIYMIGELINKNEVGSVKITGQKTYESAANYYKALLLTNSKAVFSPPKSKSKQVLLKDTILRAYPYYYLPDVVERVYEVRLQRYWYMYSELIDKLPANKTDKIKEGINLITSEFDLSLEDYFHILTGIFSWFLVIPNAKNRDPSNSDLEKLGFNPKNIDSYYIQKKNFEKDANFMNLIEKLSRDLNDFKEKLKKVRRDPVEGFYKNFQSFFDYPIFKINKGQFCITDLKFLFEGICSGFIWKINEISSQNIQGIKEQYGYLVEAYFIELLINIFGKDKIKTDEVDDNCDAILETDSHIFIFEFTTEYYRFSSLYSEDTELFMQDIHRLLFNEGVEDENSRGKKDKGKFHKLNNYLEKHKDSEKEVVPILVTENYTGDYDLLEEFNNLLSENIHEKGLGYVQDKKPLILNLDDFEAFWALSNRERASEQFIDLVDKWNKLGNKGSYHFNFSYFVSKSHEKEEIKNDMSNFFNWKEFTKSLN